jgi:hypothetical protein
MKYHHTSADTPHLAFDPKQFTFYVSTPRIFEIPRPVIIGIGSNPGFIYHPAHADFEGRFRCRNGDVFLFTELPIARLVIDPESAITIRRNLGKRLSASRALETAARLRGWFL